MSPKPSNQIHTDSSQNDKGDKKDKKDEIKGPPVNEGTTVFAIAHIYASFNDTFVVGTPRYTLRLKSQNRNLFKTTIIKCMSSLYIARDRHLWARDDRANHGRYDGET